MTIFIAHAPQDAAVAEALEKYLERRGLFVELEDGERAFRPLQAPDVVVALVSKDSVFSPWRLRFEQRMLDAWADQKLILVKLDHHFAPVGMRDLPFIDASFEAQREFTWGKVADQARALSMPKPDAPPALGAPPAPPQSPVEDVVERAPPPRLQRKSRRGGILWVLGAGLVALAALAGIVWMAERDGSGPLALGADLSQAVLIAAIAAGGLGLLALIAALVRPPRPKASPAPAPAARKRAERAPMGGVPEPEYERGITLEQIFVSYARANTPAVLPVVEEVKRQGRSVWLDTAALTGGDSWAGEIVRAIKGAQSVMVMCSTAAFESDHVKREVYLADRYKKRLLPVFVEAATPPEDFEYFFAGVQWLNLFETPEAERSAALQRALAS